MDTLYLSTQQMLDTADTGFYKFNSSSCLQIHNPWQLLVLNCWCIQWLIFAFRLTSFFCGSSSMIHKLQCNILLFIILTSFQLSIKSINSHFLWNRLMKRNIFSLNSLLAVVHLTRIRTNWSLLPQREPINIEISQLKKHL